MDGSNFAVPETADGSSGSALLDNNRVVATSKQDKPELVYFDPVGDLIIQIPGTSDEAITYSYVVSTSVLTLASPVFKALLNGNMSEAYALQDEGQSRIVLQDDDPKAMELLFKILHHCARKEMNVTIRDLAAVAVLCDKYDCIGVASPWILTWSEGIDDSGTALETGLILLIYYFLGVPTKFGEVSKNAIKILEPGFQDVWLCHPLIRLFPQEIIDDISSSMLCMMGRIRQEFGYLDFLLRSDNKCIRTAKMECLGCGKKLPQNITLCYTCPEAQLRDLYCTVETRMATYMSFLRECHVTLHEDPMETLALQELTHIIEESSTDIFHVCVGASGCSLMAHLAYFSSEIRDMMDGVEGLLLDTYITCK